MFYPLPRKIQLAASTSNWSIEVSAKYFAHGWAQ